MEVRWNEHLTAFHQRQAPIGFKLDLLGQCTMENLEGSGRRSFSEHFVEILGPFVQIQRDLTLANNYYTYLLFRNTSGAVRKTRKGMREHAGVSLVSQCASNKM